MALYLLLNRTRIGTAMRASVDNPELLTLYGGKPDRVAALAWAIGISLAALAGILLVAGLGLGLLDSPCWSSTPTPRRCSAGSRACR